MLKPFRNGFESMRQLLGSSRIALPNSLLMSVGVILQDGWGLMRELKYS
jgi:hypothetical protein